MITVVDRGFASEENLRYLQRIGGHYIAGERLRTAKGATNVVSRAGRYKVVKENLHVEPKRQPSRSNCLRLSG